VPRKKQPTASGSLKRAISLLRVSTKRQVNTDYDPEGISLPTQREANQRKAKELGVLIVDEYIEPGNTGTAISKRPVFRKMMQRIREQRDVDYIIIYQSSRMHRNWMENGAVLLELQSLGVKMISATEPLDGDSAVEEALQGMLAVFNGFQSRANGEDIKRKMTTKAERGGTLFRAPIGYLNVTETIADDEDGVRKVNTVKVDETRAPLVTAAFELYASGAYTLRSLRDKLTDDGLRTKPGGRYQSSRPVSVHRLGTMLQDRYYLGYVEWDGVERKGRHEPLISPELFDRVQRVLYGERRAGKRERTHDHYLKGVVWCDRCKSRLIITRGKSKSGNFYFYYLCRGRQEHTCDLPYLGVQKVEYAVLAHYGTVTIPTEFTARAKRAMDEAARERHGTRSTLREQLEKRLVELEGKEDHYFDLVGDPAWPKEKLATKMRAVRDERERIEAQLAIGPDKVETGRDVLASAIDLLDNPRQLYSDASVPVKRVLNKAIFTKLYVDDLGDGPVITSDELSEPFATVVYARRADAGLMTLDDERRAASEAVEAADYRTTQRGVLERNRGGSGLMALAAPELLTRAALLASAVGGRCSSKAALVGRAGLEPATKGFMATRLDDAGFVATQRFELRCGLARRGRLLYFCAKVLRNLKRRYTRA